MTLTKISLCGKGVLLEPISLQHYDGLVHVVTDGQLWNLTETVIPHPDELVAYIHKAERQFHKGEDLVFTIIDTMTRRIVGCTRLRRIDFRHKRAVIGPTFIASSWQGSHVNTESKYELLKYAFEVWRMNRIEFICDELNVRSQRAIEKIGATREGLIRSHRVTPSGRIRNSIMYSILCGEWPDIKVTLKMRLEQYGYPLSA